MKLGEDILAAWGKPFDNIDPNNMTPLDFNAFYNEYVYNLGNTGQLYEDIARHQEAVTNTIDDSRTQIAGVASEEELTNMMKFQAAYGASSRYINVINEMLEHILTRLG